ncbi:Dbl homology domain-containing protein [Daedalea quercina L-15889]|uniref:Dbl homology domain-containing protein n=1 Tax=Daedalea quercina L-15889 TaxID=1314783 RepID=A0A165P303_9APHY|nr:Dbl homology domain-containing protein [Daedalea quercina L-15889]
MKAFFNRIGFTKERDRDRTDVLREKIPQLPPLPDWPPQRSTATPTTLDSSKPLPELSDRNLPPPPLDEPDASTSTESSATPTPTATMNHLHPVDPPLEDVSNILGKHESVGSSGTARQDPDSAGRSSRKTTNGSMSNGTTSDIQKKVAFLSPPPTPAPALGSLPETDSSAGLSAAPAKSTVSRFQATHAKDTRGSTSTAASSKTDVASTARSTRQASTRPAPSPFTHRSYNDGASIHQSLRSGTPYSQMTNASSRILLAQSWSEVAEEDLVSNIGQRERTRQEVLWEIVASEERYVNELLKLKETFIDPLLHPYSASSPIASPTPLDYEEYPRSDTPRESLDHLPIAARFLSPTGSRTDSPTPQVNASPPRKDDGHPTIDGESMNSEEEGEADDQMGATYMSRGKNVSGMSQTAKHNHPRSPYNSRSTGGKFGTSLPFPSRSHQSLPPPTRGQNGAASTHSLGRQSLMAERDRDHSGESSAHSTRAPTTTSGGNVLRRFKRSQSTAPETVVNGAVPPRELPEDLRKCLEVIEGGILDGHMKLSENLRKRYEEQYPLVRSLADVFVSNSHILHGYATYVLHLERALEQVDNALSTACASKKPKKQDADQWVKVCQSLQRLEVTASDKGETGLAISLSKPFQRLLKYPLLFQNLLYHTDPSTFEYESTLGMVAEVEMIVRSIEDEKIQKEERDKTRDVFARIEGLDKVKQLMVPKPSRVLMEERPVGGLHSSADASVKPSSSPPTSSKGVKGKTSFKRLSDVLQPSGGGIGGKKDQWLVVFNDVVLRCQRTGTTSLPLVASTNSRTNSLPELQGKAKYATTGRRNVHTKPRNLYKFLKIETWAIGDVVQPREGVVSMEDVVRSRAQVHSGVQPRLVPMPDDNDEPANDSDDSDRKSKMSFSYWGADKVTVQKPIKPRQLAASVARRGAAGSPTAYGRESSANAKFGTRMMAAESPSGGARPASRRTQGTPAGGRRQAHSEEDHTVRATVTKATVTKERPAWVGNARATTTTPVQKRPRNTSQTSAATRTTTATTTAAPKQLSSPAPSEDSGVGLYRQIIAQNPSLNALNA